MTRMKGKRFKFAGALLGLALAPLAAELLLRVFGPDLSVWRVWKPGLSVVFEPSSETMPGVEGPSFFRVNALGFRGDDPVDDSSAQWLALGGSTTECLYLDQTETWAMLLQEELARDADQAPQVYIGGKSGLCLRDNIVQLRALLPQHPELDAVLLLVGANDLLLRLAQGDEHDPWALADPDVASQLYVRSFQIRPLAAIGGPIWKRTAFWQALSRTRKRVGGERMSQDAHGEIYHEWRAEREAARPWRDSLPPLDSALAGFRDQLIEAAALCRGAGVRLVLLTQPSVWSAELSPAAEANLWMGRGVDGAGSEGRDEFYTPARLAEGMALYNAEIRRFAAAQDLECIDIAQALGPNEAYFYDDVHFNEAGAREVTRLLVEHFSAPGSDH